MWLLRHRSQKLTTRHCLVNHRCCVVLTPPAAAHGRRLSMYLSARQGLASRYNSKDQKDTIHEL